MSTVVTLGPVGFKPTGAYDNTREYKKLDVVIYQGSSYIAKSDSIGQLPTNTTYWEMLVQKGDTGEKGEKGDPGEVTEEQLDEAMARANMVYNALPKVSDEGDNLTLDGTANCPMKMELKGNTEQTTYTGINKVRVLDKEQTTINNITYSVTDGIISWSGTASRNTSMLIEFNDITLPAGTYYFYLLRTKTTRVDISLRTTNNVMIDVANFGNAFQNTLSNKSFTLSSDTVIHSMNLYFLDGTDTTDTYKIMICTASHTATEYEPYVGGTPSPSPDYPQDVRVVTGNNSVKVIGKNLYGAAIKTDNMTGSSCNIITDTSNKLEIQGIINFYSGIYKKYQLKPNTQYTISLKYSEIGNNSRSRIYYKLGNNCENITIVDNNGNIDIGTTTTSLTFTTDNTGLVAILFCCNWTTNTGYIVYNDIQLEQGSATTYEPYQSQTYPINLGTMELCKIRGYQDYIYKDNGKWYKHSEIGKVVLNGSEENLSYSSTANRLQMPFNLQTQDWGALALTLCDHFTRGDTEIVDGSFNITRTTLFFKNNNLTSLNDWKTWLGSNNTSVYYVLAASTNTEITDTTLIGQLNAIENAVSYATQTNIVQENYSEPFIINAECVRSLKDIFELIQ